MDAESAVNASLLEPDHGQLERATAVVAARYAGPQCVEASALLVEVGARLGYSLQARAVSLFAHNHTPKGSVVTGEQGRAFGESFLMRNFGRVAPQGEFTGGTPFQRNAGHMIVVSEEYSLLMDPTFAQFRSLGKEAVPLFVREAPLKAGRFWQTADDNFFVRYFAADDFMELDFDRVREQAQAEADRIVDYLRASEA